jgi:polyhydroxyalkanoate synthesis regulator phasin
MGIFNQFKEAQEAMKNMSPDEVQQMMDQAKEAQKQLETMIEKKVEEAIRDKDLVSKEEVRKMVEK